MLRAGARGWLRTLGRRPRDVVTLKLSAETAAMAAHYLSGLGPVNLPGDDGKVRWRLMYLLGFACAHGKAKEHGGRGFTPYAGAKRTP